MSADHNRRIADDLGRKISVRLEEIMQRETDLAQQLLPANEVVHMLMNVSTGVAMAVILAGLQAMTTGTDPSEFFDLMRSAFDERIGASKQRALMGLQFTKSMDVDGMRAAMAALR